MSFWGPKMQELLKECDRVGINYHAMGMHEFAQYVRKVTNRFDTENLPFEKFAEAHLPALREMKPIAMKLVNSNTG